MTKRRSSESLLGSGGQGETAVLGIVERILAALIILALLTLLILLAIPQGPRESAGPVPSGSKRSAEGKDRQEVQAEDKPAKKAPEEPAREPAAAAPETKKPAATVHPASESERAQDSRIEPTHRIAEGRHEPAHRIRRDRAVIDDCGGNDCDCCCGRERRIRTVERRRPYWAEPERPYRVERSRPYWAEPRWAQIPPGACPD
jgi:hypothetical protein